MIGDGLVGAQVTWLGVPFPVGGGESWNLDTWGLEVGDQVSVLTGAGTAWHLRVDLTEIADDTKS